MADRAVALDMAADAGADVPLCLPSVMAGRPRPVGPLRLGWVEPAALGQVAKRPGHRDAHTLVAGQTEGLISMAAATFLLVFPGDHRVHAEPIIGVHPA